MSVNPFESTYTLPNGTVYGFGGATTVNCTISVCPIGLSVYRYRPSLPLSSVLIALYGLCIFIQFGLALRYKTWGFMVAMTLGCIDEIIGWAGRIMIYKNPWNHTGFIIQIVLITIGPVFFSAAVYVMLSQIANYISAKAARFPPVYFYYIFIPCDILSLILQAVGGAMSSISNGRSQAGNDIAVAGLVFQVATLATFLCLMIDYFIRSRPVWMTRHLPLRFKSFVFFIYLATILILVRCCYRVYELKKGYTRDNKALRNQKLLIGFEAVMIILAAYCLTLAHPGPVFHSGNKEPGDGEK